MSSEAKSQILLDPSQEVSNTHYEGNKSGFKAESSPLGAALDASPTIKGVSINLNKSPLSSHDPAVGRKMLQEGKETLVIDIGQSESKTNTGFKAETQVASPAALRSHTGKAAALRSKEGSKDNDTQLGANDLASAASPTTIRSHTKSIKKHRKSTRGADDSKSSPRTADKFSLNIEKLGSEPSEALNQILK